MTEVLEMSVHHETLAQALVGFQADAPRIQKTRTGQIQNRTYSYADLGDILPAIQKTLAKHGLAWTARPIIALGMRPWEGVTTTPDDPRIRLPEPVLFYSLVHESREREDGLMPLGLSENWTPQQFGSALTYARRYAMSAQLGLATDEDDDGASATKASEPAQTHPQARTAHQTVTPASAKQRGAINKHAGVQGLKAEELANCVKKVMGQQPGQWRDSIQAERWLGRALDRFPANKVTDLLAEIDIQPSPLERDQLVLDQAGEKQSE